MRFEKGVGCFNNLRLKVFAVTAVAAFLYCVDKFQNIKYNKNVTE